MLISAIVFVVSVLLMTVALLTYARESQSGDRLFLSGARQQLDSVLERLGAMAGHVYMIVGRFFVQLWWRYLIHVSLRTVLVGMSKLYDRLIAYFEYNRTQAKSIRQHRKQWQQSSHLTHIATHKAETALTEDEKKRRRRAALDE